MVYFLILIVLTACGSFFILLKKIYIHTSTMAVVMALGIMTQGVLSNFFGSRFILGIVEKVLSVIILSLWCSFSFSLLLSFFNKKFKSIHYSQPINRFGIGTWVAGTSICGILIDKQFIEWSFISQIFLGVNLFLWVIYITGSMRVFYELRQNLHSKNAHGILLLTTVSTQSIVLLICTVDRHVPFLAVAFLITLGIGFYLIGAVFILMRYVKTDSWSIKTDWNNTNCILHGALSITGLACMVSHVLSKQGVILLWMFAAIAFLLIESIEIYRLISRLKSYGIKKGILVYDVSQWSRIFTFGMFYTITFQIAPDQFFLSMVRKMVITTGIWVILVLGTFELLLCLKQYYITYKKISILFRKSSGKDLEV